MNPFNIGIPKVHYHVSKKSEHFPLKWFFIKISHHNIGQTILYAHPFLIYTIGYKEVPNIDVLCSITAGTLTIVLQLRDTLVVLIYDVIRDGESLVFEKIAHS